MPPKKQAGAPNIDNHDAWRQIPPEEKFEAMARAQSHGIAACLGAIIVGGTVAGGLQQNMFFWAII